MAAARPKSSAPNPRTSGGKKAAAAKREKKAGKKAAAKQPPSRGTATSEMDPFGRGGETHQVATELTPALTTRTGTPISDDQNSLKIGDRGPTLLEDFVMREKIFHFDHERIPERVVHARGFGAKGYFENYESLAELTSAQLFQAAGDRTEVFVRFSTVAGSLGSPDLARDVRGFAVKFYTAEGNWDLVGNNIPVFFIQDAMKFPDLIHAAKSEPDRGFPQAQTAHDNFWDFVSLMPESTHMLLWAMSDRAIPRSFRFMEGFGVHSFRFVNEAGESTYVKFHWKPLLGMQSVTWDEAVKINGADPDFHRRDLWNSIQNGDAAEWELGVQIFDDDFADGFEFDILDPTKLIPEELIPVRPIGRLVLDQVVDNFFAETEQVAFCTQNVVPGIDFTNDPLLQGRNFSYLDTQLKRLGSPNFTDLPVNAARCPVALFQQDGHMTLANPPGRANYEPNSWGDQGGPREDPVRGFRSFAARETGDTRRVRSESFADHYSQARQFYVSQTPNEQNHIGAAFTFELSKVQRADIRERMVSRLVNVHEDLAAAVANGLGIPVPAAAPSAVAVRTDLPASPALSILANPPGTFSGRRVGALVSNGTDASMLRALRRALDTEGAELMIVAPSIDGIIASDGTTISVDERIGGGPSVLFDAVAIIPGEGDVPSLAEHPGVHAFVADAFVHCKFIAFDPAADLILQSAGIADDKRDDGFTTLDTAKHAGTFVEQCRALRFWPREAALP